MNAGSFVIGLALLGFSIVATATALPKESVPTNHGARITRAEQPRLFWAQVASYGALGTVGLVMVVTNVLNDLIGS